MVVVKNSVKSSWRTVAPSSTKRPHRSASQPVIEGGNGRPGIHAGQVLNIGAGLGNMTPLLRSWATMFMAWNASVVTGYSFRKRMGSPEGVSGR